MPNPSLAITKLNIYKEEQRGTQTQQDNNVLKDPTPKISLMTDHFKRLIQTKTYTDKNRNR